LLITDTKTLTTFLADMGRPAYVAVDTEFMSEKTYDPQLCLIQLAHGNHVGLIDTLSGLDLNPLLEFLADPQVTKVFHASDQDLAILWNQLKIMPQPLFDTQIAAMVCGFGDQVSYASLVSTFTNQRPDKSAQLIDWSKRPLFEKHLDYARKDVTQLCLIYEALVTQIEDRDRGDWIAQEMADLADPSRYEFDADKQMRRIKFRNPSPRNLAILKELVIWREGLAKSRNQPRQWVMKDTSLRDMASNPPASIKELARIRGIGGIAQGATARDILACVERGRQIPKADCPAVLTPEREDALDEGLLNLLRTLLQKVSNDYDVSPKLLATSSDLSRLARGKACRLQEGWRYELFGRQAQELLQGKLGLTIAEGVVSVVKM
jgi:ribonuclease D